MFNKTVIERRLLVPQKDGTFLALPYSPYWRRTGYIADVTLKDRFVRLEQRLQILLLVALFLLCPIAIVSATYAAYSFGLDVGVLAWIAVAAALLALPLLFLLEGFKFFLAYRLFRQAPAVRFTATSAPPRPRWIDLMALNSRRRLWITCAIASLWVLYFLYIGVVATDWVGRVLSAALALFFGYFGFLSWRALHVRKT